MIQVKAKKTMRILENLLVFDFEKSFCLIWIDSYWKVYTNMSSVLKSEQSSVLFYEVIHRRYKTIIHEYANVFEFFNIK